MTTPTDKAAHHDQMAEYYQNRINALVLRYGTGVRPGWVGEDIAMDSAQRDYHRDAAQALRDGEAA